MKIPYAQINAFTNSPFGGNPAGVCLLERWPSNEMMINIAAENDLSETAFVLTNPVEGAYPLRWFTPTTEMDLCGHATLATATLFFADKIVAGGTIRFSTKSGILSAEKRGEIVEMNFPSRPAQACLIPDGIVNAFGKVPRGVFKSRDYMAVFDSETDILALRPDFCALAQLDCLGVMATAPGKDCDFVSRFFAPRAGINEDPVTGSAHCTLIPYWSARLGKKAMFARQLSKRGGELFCRDEGNRVIVGGKCRTYLRGEIVVE